MYRLVFDSYLDFVMSNRGTARRQGAQWYPDRDTAERAAARMRALGQPVWIECLAGAQPEHSGSQISADSARRRSGSSRPDRWA